jgi:hypothetical protein
MLIEGSDSITDFQRTGSVIKSNYREEEKEQKNLTYFSQRFRQTCGQALLDSFVIIFNASHYRICIALRIYTGQALETIMKVLSSAGPLPRGSSVYCGGLFLV